MTALKSNFLASSRPLEKSFSKASRVALQVSSYTYNSFLRANSGISKLNLQSAKAVLTSVKSPTTSATQASTFPLLQSVTVLVTSVTKATTSSRQCSTSLSAKLSLSPD